MAALSDYLEDALLNHVLRNVAYTSPTTVYVALFSTDPTDAGSGTEVSGGSYARQAATFGAPSGGASSNSAQIDFTDMPAETVTHVGIFDASTSGNLLFHGSLTASKTTNAGDTLTISASDLTVTLQ